VYFVLLNRVNSFLSYVPVVFAAVALLCGAPGNLYCETFSFTDKNASRNTVYVGAFGYRTKKAVEIAGNTFYHSYCANYDELTDDFGYKFDVDSKWKTTKAFAIMSAALGGIFLILGCIAPCCALSPGKWMFLGIMFIILCLFQGLTLLSLDSNICLDNPVANFLEEQKLGIEFPEECEWEAGFRLNIASVAMWFAAAVAVFMLPPPKKYPVESPQTQEVTYEQTVNPDGTTTVQKTAVVKGTNVRPPQASAEVEAPEVQMKE
jgi:hypothetical protein